MVLRFIGGKYLKLVESISNGNYATVFGVVFINIILESIIMQAFGSTMSRIYTVLSGFFILILFAVAAGKILSDYKRIRSLEEFVTLDKDKDLTSRLDFIGGFQMV